MEQRKQYIKQPGTYTATLDSVVARPTKLDATKNEIVFEFKTTQGEYIGKKFVWPVTAQSKGQNFYYKKFQEALGFTDNDKPSSKVGTVVSLTVVPNQWQGKTYMNIDTVTSATPTQLEAVQAAAAVFNV